MSNFKTTHSIFHALVLATGLGAATSVAHTANAQGTTDAFAMADSNGDKGLDRNEFPVFISLKSGNSSVISLVSDSTSYEIPFANKDKNEDGLLDAKELKLVERDVPAWDAPQATETESETESVEDAPVMEAPIVDEAPVVDMPEMADPVIQEPVIEEPTIEEPVVDELIIEPMEEGTPDVTDVEPLPEDIEDPELSETIEPQPEG